MNRVLLIFLGISFSVVAWSQSSSYEMLESRFSKSTLSSKDSAAFKEAGLMKANALFEYGDVYRSNVGNSYNQTYVTNRVPELFYSPDSLALNTDSIMNLIDEVIQNELPNRVKIKCVPQEGTLGHVVTNTSPLNFEADIVLIRTSKSFGTSQEQIWQVFLSDPMFTRVQSKKYKQK